MWTHFTNLVGKGFDKKISAIGLGLFRIAYSIVLLLEVIQLYLFNNLIFDAIPFIQPSDVDFRIGLICWGFAITSLGLGFHTRVAAIVNYLFTLTFLGTMSTYEYHMFYVYLGMNAMMIFLPLHKALSIDLLTEKIRYSTLDADHEPDQSTTVLSYYLPIFIGLAFVYSDSMLYKLLSPTWMGGLGMWKPANLPMMTWTDSTWLMNNRWFAMAGGYITLVYETVFIFLFWFRRFRVPLLVTGILLHLGIAWEFPIPWFGLGVTAILILLVPVNWWSKIKVRRRDPVFCFFYDANCPLCLRTRLILSHFDIRGGLSFKPLQKVDLSDHAFSNLTKEELLNNVYGLSANGKLAKGLDAYVQVFFAMGYTWPIAIFLRLPVIHSVGLMVYSMIANARSTDRCGTNTCSVSVTGNAPVDNQNLFFKLSKRDLQVQLLSAGLAFVILLQLSASYHSDLPKRLRQTLGVDASLIGRPLDTTTKYIKSLSRIFLGITNHAVFMDYHFENYNHLIAITYQENDGTERFLPITSEDGRPGKYLIGFTFVKWNWRVNSNNIDTANLKKGVRDFTAFWAVQNDISLQDARFNIKVKRIEIPSEWRKDFLREQLRAPWEDGGYAVWTDEVFRSYIHDIEEI